MISQKSLVVIIDAHLLAFKLSFLRVCKLSLVGILLLPLYESITKVGAFILVIMLINIVLYVNTLFFVTRSINRR